MLWVRGWVGVHCVVEWILHFSDVVYTPAIYVVNTGGKCRPLCLHGT
jgi:hypothetical protein